MCDQTLENLRAELKRRNLDAFLLPRYDAHQGEYIAPRDMRLGYVTGFTGSAGMAIITADHAAVFVDGRYVVQVRKQSPAPKFSHHHILEEPPESWLEKNLMPGARVGFDPMHWPPVWYDRFDAAVNKIGGELVAEFDNPVDAIWPDQPDPPKGKIDAFPMQYAGRSAVSKIEDHIRFLRDLGADFHVETQPDNIAWLLNVRGQDADFLPVPHSFLLINAKGPLLWFVDQGKFVSDVEQSLPADVNIRPMDQFLVTLRDEVSSDQTVLIDPDFSPVGARLVLEEIGARITLRQSGITSTKAAKNTTELEGMRACHVQDGAAWVEFLSWLHMTVPQRAAAGNPVNEREAEEKIAACRKKREGYLEESFNPISAAAANGAMCHYATTETEHAPILPDHPYLLDSGGQYETGTTDATRSVSFGTVPAGYERAYTAVFKAFCALATLRFPPGTQGHHIDAICRRPLWDIGLDYDHGTGHGIGHRLSVHEHPQRIGRPVSPVDLVPGMVMSIEPGHYIAGLYGIRIENLFSIYQDSDGFMGFENMTWIPIQTDMLIVDQLNDRERGWINSYHAELLQRLSPLLSDSAKSWLSTACKSL